MSERKQSQAGLLRNKSILIIAIVILIFLILPWVFIATSSSIRHVQVSEEVGLVKKATDLLSPQAWWPLLLSSEFFLSLAFLLATRRYSPKPVEDSNLALNGSTKRLATLGILTLLVYVIYFLLPFPLHRYYNLRRVSMGWIADRSWVAAITLSCALVALFLLYISAYRITLRQNTRRLWALVLLGSFLFALINFFMFPISSTDLNDYVSRGRISGVHGGNPLVQVPNDYPDDPYVQLAAWRDDPSAYGPLWEVLSGFIGRYSGGPLWNDILGYKGLALISYLLSTVTIAAILKRVAPHRSLAGTLLFAWNPLILLEGVANAHNDMIMMVFVLTGFWILSQIQHVDLGTESSKPSVQNLLYGGMALSFLTFAVLVKFVPILLLPPLLLYLISQEKGWKRRFGSMLLYLLPITLILFFYYRVFWKWPEITNSMIHRTEMFRMSLASLVKLILSGFIQKEWAQGIAAWFFLVAFVVVYLLFLLRSAHALGLFSSKFGTARSPYNGKGGKFFKWVQSVILWTRENGPWDILVSTSLLIILIYLLLGSLWFWPWYLIWPIALVTLSKNKRWIIILTVVSCAGQLSHILWNFVWYWMGIEWDTLYVVETLVLLLMIVPAIAIYLIHRRQGQLKQTIPEDLPPSGNTHLF